MGKRERQARTYPDLTHHPRARDSPYRNPLPWLARPEGSSGWHDGDIEVCPPFRSILLVGCARQLFGDREPDAAMPYQLARRSSAIRGRSKTTLRLFQGVDT